MHAPATHIPLCHAHPLLGMPPTMHALPATHIPLSCMPSLSHTSSCHTHPPVTHAPPATHPPLCHTCPLPCMVPPPQHACSPATHTPWHVCPPDTHAPWRTSPDMHAPYHAHPPCKRGESLHGARIHLVRLGCRSAPVSSRLLLLPKAY